MENNNSNETIDTTEGTEGASNEQQTFSKEEVLALIQAESDKRVTQALKTQEKKFKKELSLSKLDDDAREKAEKDNLIAELQEQLAAFQVEKNRSELKSVLSARGLSAEFADIIAISDDIEEAQANIDKLDTLFKQAVKEEVSKRIAGNTPKGNGGSMAELTKEAVQKMSIAELQELKNTKPEIYNKFYN